MHHLLKRFLLAALVVSGVSIGGVSAQSQVLTGKVVADELRTTIEQAEGSGQVLIGQMGIQAQAALTRLETILGDKITTPLDQLDATLRAEVSAARGVANTLKGTLGALPKCVGNEAQLLVAGVKSGLNTSLSGIPLVKGVPLAYLVEDMQRSVPYVIKHEPNMGDRHLVVRGANLWNADQVCSISAKAVGLNNDSEFSLPVLAHDVEKVDLRMPSNVAPGQYILKIQAEKKRLLGLSCADPITVSAGFSVAPPQQVKISVSDTPVCKVVERYSFTGSVQQSNNGCNTGTKRESRLIAFDRPGFTLERFEFRDRSNSRGGARAEISGNGVQVTASAQGRGNTCSHGKGKGRGVVTLHGVRELPSREDIARSVGNFLIKQGESKEFMLAAVPANCEVESYILRGAGNFIDGLSLALPPITVQTDQQQTASEAGLRLLFNGQSRSGTLALDGTCL